MPKPRKPVRTEKSAGDSQGTLPLLEDAVDPQVQESPSKPGPKLESHKLYEIGEKGLFDFLRQADRWRIETELDMGRAVDTIIQRHTYMTPEEFDNMFRTKCGMDYKEAVVLRRFWIAYEKDPSEVYSYGRTAARLLAQVPTVLERGEAWEKTGSIGALKKFFREHRDSKAMPKPSRPRIKLVFH